jgi:hypothetical protein
MGSFASTWRDLRAALKPGDQLRGWSKAKGQTDLQFHISEVGPTWIGILPTTGNVRRISKGDFDRVYAFWPAYKRGEITRAQMRDISQNTSYIFAMLNWVERDRSR